MHRLALVAVAVAALLCLGARPARPGRSQIEAELRQALVSWAAGEEREALAAHRRANELAAGSGQLGLLRSVKESTARTLRRQPDALVAYLRLEERAYTIYAAERLPGLAGPIRQQLPALIQQGAGKRASAAERRLAAELLASFGGALHEAGQDGAAAQVFTLARLYDPGQHVAAVGLAALHEKRGEYEAAAAHLRQIARAVPADREARLRLALVLARTGRLGEAEGQLRLLAGNGDDWVRSLAAQELARLASARGELRASLALLDSASAALPCDSALQVQAAYLAERAGLARPLDLGTLADCGEAVESARARYTRPPAGALARLRQDLAAREPAWREALGRATARGRR